MKKIAKISVNSIKKLAVAAAGVNVNSTCAFWAGQLKVPKNAKKHRKF